jgi:hypothetical protein
LKFAARLPGVFFRIIFRRMVERRTYHRPARHLALTKVLHVSPDDIKSRMLERDRLAAADTRTEAQRWLGDPPLDRSALAMKQTLKQS